MGSPEFDVLAGLLAERRYLFDTIYALGHLGFPDAVPLLAPLLEDQSLEERLRRVHAPNALGSLRHPSAFAPLERLVRRQWPRPSIDLLEATIVTGRNSAIPLLEELWDDAAGDSASLVRETVLLGLIWLATPEATEAVLRLVPLADTTKVALLAQVMWHRSGLSFLNSIGGGAPVDDRLVALIEQRFDQMGPEQQQKSILAMEKVGTEQAIRWVERVAGDPAYDERVAGDPAYDERVLRAGTETQQTVRTAAIDTLRHLGSASVMDEVLDELSGKQAHSVASSLEKMDRGAVRAALIRRLPTADEVVLVRLLEILSWFGDRSVLADICPYIQASRPPVADAAYEAEQRIRGLADIAA